MAGKRTYVVAVDLDNLRLEDNGLNAPREQIERLVKASTPAGARLHVVRDAVSARYAEQEDLERLLTKGVKVEEAE